MSRGSKTRRKKGVVLKKSRVTEVSTSGVQEADVVPIKDIYLSVVASLGFDPIKEAEERRRHS